MTSKILHGTFSPAKRVIKVGLATLFLGATLGASAGATEIQNLRTAFFSVATPKSPGMPVVAVKECSPAVSRDKMQACFDRCNTQTPVPRQCLVQCSNERYICND